MSKSAFLAHLATGSTTVCHAWAVIRRDGVRLGFTDHDRSFSFDDIEFRADTGMTARVLQQSTGLSVDNTEAMGMLNDAAIADDDILAGRFDQATVKVWLVNWANVSQRMLRFAGKIGEITRSADTFNAELRGLAEPMSQPRGRIYQRACSAILGDGACRFRLNAEGFSAIRAVRSVSEARVIRLADLGGFDDRWFERGRLIVQDGVADGLAGVIKADRRLGGGAREIELWQALPVAPKKGDTIRIEAGCDKRASTCRGKFNNFMNFSGFPHIPGEDWMTSYPTTGTGNDGGSLLT
jgi:uncharacterized phage protein (TIGR02218 family)